MRFALAPGWIALHLLSVALVVTMVLLGRWQLDVSNSKHFDLQNFGYALQWWAFSGFVIVMWVRVMRDRIRQHAQAGGTPGMLVVPFGPTPIDAASIDDLDRAARAGDARTVPDADAGAAPVGYRRYLMPNSSQTPIQSSDPEHRAYNDYLARLAADDLAKGEGSRR